MLVNGCRGAMLACVCTAAMAGAGCGGGDSDDEAQSKPAAGDAMPAIKGSPAKLTEKVADEIARAKRKKDCTAVTVASPTAGLPCPAPAAFRESMADFDISAAKTYGTGAVIDYTSGGAPNGGSVVLLGAFDGAWRIRRWGLLAGRTVGTADDRSRSGFDVAVDGYLKAVRERDCDLFRRHAVTLGTREVACKFELRDTAGLAKQLKPNPDASPVYLGGNRAFGFYGLTLKKPAPAYYTLAVSGTGKDAPVPFQVMTAAAGPSPRN